MSRDMSVRISGLGISVVAHAEGVSWSGEVMRDLMNRAADGFARALEVASQYDDVDEGVEVTTEGDDDDD